ncbi:hypothetical protein CC85DRAFT_314139 [Cutaneotrichosporon oleaginosum]|uniref:UPF3 domain-containing protein n=1 Tax=Cutaneotrichosporon oleaginosum TaxID=879819 RepID=A0A0J0XD27_9TREE|nr:uncharacterized protein CC85DRAFT_314139 [Cutaneotrichosporon oleaginosum]KLT38953.1 hypothetical protein CC85DRAFT_314139 [Cutaneotrichosporon oleaginosum]TXT07601.1 hypothetical protein COLE_04525 [Cutaneotrichosporon oleaginosum]
MPRGTKAPAPRLKLVIRRLPPTLPEETFWRVVEPFVEGKSLWRRYVKGRAGDAFGVHPQHSRAYVLMNDTESLIAFHAGFDGHIFRNKAGVEYQAVIEYAPIEKTPYKAKVKKDAREGTIDDDPDYLAFLENRGAVEAKASPEITAASQPTSTPLLEALRAAANKSRAKAAKKKEKAASKKDEKDSKADAKSDKARAAALASISEAATKRAPKTAGSGGVVMVAGKGREVFVAPAEVVQEGDSRDSKKSDKAGEKKKRKPRKKKEAGEDGGEHAGTIAAGAGKSASASASAPPAPKKDARIDGGLAVVDESSTEAGKRRNRRKRAPGTGRGGGGAGGGEGRPVTEGSVVEENSGQSRSQKPRAAREQGAATSRDGSAVSAPRGRGRGGLLPSEARIDM